ncbi:hypothetical protein EJ05DRAFT_232683 [Pseudovirgaria hyperparasitica]|uniref:Uncharacterized protein n=1 Tax=Pseudovirgaria hyperparasitica TaxID=470096 RepID=A0A6A6VS56_9PEZI|nr:uncharacterized protein EJ05DRAFT_232683 [Pseudovirgaria hyperparasitica]KAF2752975.1 hypothetical protein EJ05DRAFT_232683 [Pseudovirgaria hyperparasitica]
MRGGLRTQQEGSTVDHSIAPHKRIETGHRLILARSAGPKARKDATSLGCPDRRNASLSVKMENASSEQSSLCGSDIMSMADLSEEPSSVRMTPWFSTREEVEAVTREGLECLRQALVLFQRPRGNVNSGQGLSDWDEGDDSDNEDYRPHGKGRGNDLRIAWTVKDHQEIWTGRACGKWWTQHGTVQAIHSLLRLSSSLLASRRYTLRPRRAHRYYAVVRISHATTLLVAMARLIRSPPSRSCCH